MLIPRNIVLEITESFAINDMERVLKIISGLKALGPRIALDDFKDRIFIA